MSIKKSYILICASLMTVLSSCKEGFSVPYYVGCPTDAEPFCYYDQNGELTGIEVDLIKAIGEDQGIWLDFIPSTQEESFTELNKRRHKMDCAVGLIEWTTDREDRFTFVSPAYFTSSFSLATAKNSAISSYQDMNGRTLAVKRGSLAEQYASSISEDYGFTIKTYETYEEIFKAVENGQVDALQEHYALIKYRIDKKQANLKIVDEGVKNLSIAIITEKDEDKTLRKYLFNGLASLYEDDLINRIINKYLN